MFSLVHYGKYFAGKELLLLLKGYGTIL